MMNLTDATAAMIVCSRDMGRMLPRACARMWTVANKGAPGTLQRTCCECPDGEKRAALVTLQPRQPTATGRTNGAADRACRACGSVYTPTNRRQQFCKDAGCQASRAVAAVKRSQLKKRQPVAECYDSTRRECS